MAFRKMPTAEERAREFEAKVAAARPYSVANRDQAIALYLHIHRKGGWQEREERLEATRRHIASRPDDLRAAAGLLVADSDVLLGANNVADRAVALLDGTDRLAPHEMRLSEWLGAEAPRPGLDVDDDYVYVPGIDEGKLEEIEDTEGRFEHSYAVAPFARSKTDFALLVLDEDDGKWMAIGAYVGKALVIVQGEHRGLGLSKHLILATAAARGAPLANEYTEAGWRAHVAAHRHAVIEALDDEEFVPDGVLEDHGLRTGARPCR